MCDGVVSVVCVVLWGVCRSCGCGPSSPPLPTCMCFGEVVSDGHFLRWAFFRLLLLLRLCLSGYGWARRGGVIVQNLHNHICTLRALLSVTLDDAHSLRRWCRLYVCVRHCVWLLGLVSLTLVPAVCWGEVGTHGCLLACWFLYSSGGVCCGAFGWWLCSCHGGVVLSVGSTWGSHRGLREVWVFG